MHHDVEGLQEPRLTIERLLVEFTECDDLIPEFDGKHFSIILLSEDCFDFNDLIECLDDNPRIYGVKSCWWSKEAIFRIDDRSELKQKFLDRIIDRGIKDIAEFDYEEGEDDGTEEEKNWYG